MRYNRPFRNQNARHRVKAFDPSNLVNNLIPTIQPEAVVFEPKNKFSDFGFHAILNQNISNKKFPGLTPIQDLAIPELIAGKDVVGIANTGSGKTAAFLTPLIQKILKDRAQKVLILAPTRELAVQIEQELRSFSGNTGIKSALCIGGVGIRGQQRMLRFNPNFVIGTPGRIKDLAYQRSLNLSQFGNLVLDEVDRMLDMGFIKDVTEILQALPRKRQTAFFSATLTNEVTQIMNGYLVDPIKITVKTNSTLNCIAQEIIKTNGKPKIEILHDLLLTPGYDKVLVFGRTKHGLEHLADDLARRGFNVAAIHGNKSQYQRQFSLEQFKNNRVKVLLATDIASRGLDIDNVTHVINFDSPESYEDYVHRIGRTGRANKKGMAVTLVP